MLTRARIANFLNSLDWSGHIEIGDNDRNWLADQIHGYVNPPKSPHRCECCEELAPIVIQTPLGKICESCIEQWHENAEDIRTAYEETA